jgi:alcohol dehydrogenase class IV
MNILTKCGYRIFQKLFYIGLLFVPQKVPHILHSVSDVAGILKNHDKSRVLLVTDKPAVTRGAIDALVKSLTAAAIDVSIYDGVLPNPTIAQIEQGLAVYYANKCDCIVAFGGGSVIDCAKVVGARVSHPHMSVRKMEGLLKLRHKLPLFVAIPTTAGTGSEATLAAVITDDATHAKCTIDAFQLVPDFAVLDPMLTVSLPKFFTATCGMDALTHAVEAYIGSSNTKITKNAALEAVKLIFDNILTCFSDGNNVAARGNMLRASFLAGKAFTRAYVGYVHALAHALGGKYGVPHGLAVSILMPSVLRKYGKCAHKKLAQLARAVGLAGSSNSDLANKFIDAIAQLNSKMGIPATLPSEYQLDDATIGEMVALAQKEAHPLYPVPKFFDHDTLAALYNGIR